ncbi:MAG: hypothetical protein JRD94_10950 [Deltaproteobacteria bacterium]|nr:hypothetical protein [Deltaproteobacteria bacterium]
MVTPPFADIYIANAKPGADGWVVPRRDGTRAVLTIDHDLQSHVRSLFGRYDVPAGGLVAIDPKTGEVLAYVGYEAGKGDSARVLTDPDAPAASVFKIITASALLDAGVKSSTSVCYGGGMRGLVAADLIDSPKRDRWCATMADALGYSINAVFAKLADRHIDEARMTQYVSAFGFGQRLPFDLPTTPSPVDVPDSRLERARMAAGFWHSQMSPLHGALVASTIANDGKMPYAAIVDRIESRTGERDDDQHGHQGNREEGVLRFQRPPVPAGHQRCWEDGNPEPAQPAPHLQLVGGLCPGRRSENRRSRAGGQRAQVANQSQLRRTRSATRVPDALTGDGGSPRDSVSASVSPRDSLSASVSASVGASERVGDRVL